MIDLTAIYSIHFSDGQLHPYRRNDRRAKCARCRKPVAMGDGYRFRKGRFADMRSGYWCEDCVGVLLKCVSRWAWNGFIKQLYIANEDTTRLIRGRSLWAAWLRGSYSELGKILHEIK